MTDRSRLAAAAVGRRGRHDQNFGGYDDAPGQNVNENAVVAVVQSFLTGDGHCLLPDGAPRYDWLFSQTSR